MIDGHEEQTLTHQRPLPDHATHKQASMLDLHIELYIRPNTLAHNTDHSEAPEHYIPKYIGSVHSPKHSHIYIPTRTHIRAPTHNVHIIDTHFAGFTISLRTCQRARSCTTTIRAPYRPHANATRSFLSTPADKPPTPSQPRRTRASTPSGPPHLSVVVAPHRHHNFFVWIRLFDFPDCVRLCLCVCVCVCMFVAMATTLTRRHTANSISATQRRQHSVATATTRVRK